MATARLVRMRHHRGGVAVTCPPPPRTGLDLALAEIRSIPPSAAVLTCVPHPDNGRSKSSAGDMQRLRTRLHIRLLAARASRTSVTIGLPRYPADGICASSLVAIAVAPNDKQKRARCGRALESTGRSRSPHPLLGSTLPQRCRAWSVPLCGGANAPRATGRTSAARPVALKRVAGIVLAMPLAGDAQLSSPVPPVRTDRGQR